MGINSGFSRLPAVLVIAWRAMQPALPCRTLMRLQATTVTQAHGMPFDLPASLLSDSKSHPFLFHQTNWTACQLCCCQQVRQSGLSKNCFKKANLFWVSPIFMGCAPVRGRGTIYAKLPFAFYRACRQHVLQRIKGWLEMNRLPTPTGAQMQVRTHFGANHGSIRLC